MDIRQDRQSIAHRVFQQLQTWVTENDDHELTRNSIPIECLARNGESMVSTGAGLYCSRLMTTPFCLARQSGTCRA